MSKKVNPTKVPQDNFEGNLFYNQTQLAKLSGMSMASVSRYLKRHPQKYKTSDTGRSKLYDTATLRDLQHYREQQLTADNVVHESASSKALATQNKTLQTVNKKLTQELAAKDKLIEKLTHDNDLLVQVVQANTQALQANNEINQKRLEIEQNAEKRLSAPSEKEEEPKKKGLFSFWKK